MADNNKTHKHRCSFCGREENQVAFLVIGHDVTITMAAEAGQLELNAFEPVLYYQLFESITAMTAAVDTFVENCILGITAIVCILISMFGNLATNLPLSIGLGCAGMGGILSFVYQLKKYKADKKEAE